MIRRPPRSTLDRSSAASDVYKRQTKDNIICEIMGNKANTLTPDAYLATGERNRDENGKAVLTSMCDRRLRRLTPTECERLQTVPVGYTDGVSDTQRYRMLGNGWTVNVIAHFLSLIHISEPTRP